MMDFEQRLHKAVERGERRKDAQAAEARAKALGEEECKRLHSQHRLPLAEHIEDCLRRLADHFPGFRVESIVGEAGWGGAASRDDIEISRKGRRDNAYSRLEMVIRPFNRYHVLDLAAKGTIRNKEIFNRNQYQLLTEVDMENFLELIDLWILEYAEQYAASE